jgi:DNA-binding IscR family transcriptional regulator
MFMSPFEKDVLLPKLQELNRWAGAVNAVLLADHVAISERYARLLLNKLEKVGMVERPHGRRKGWSVVQLRAV